MGQDPSTSGTPVTEAENPAQIREQIEDTRQELGDTVEALAAKTDVKAQVGRKVEKEKTTLISVGTAAGVAAAAFLGWRLVKRRRRKR